MGWLWIVHLLLLILSIDYHYYPKYIDKEGKNDIDMFAGGIIAYIYVSFVVC